MKRNMALEWIKASYSDIVVLRKIADDEFITHMTAFHSQQSVEKALKAILEFHNKDIPKKHDVQMLKDLVIQYISIENEDILEDLNSLYLDSRYPSSFGLLPNGKPTLIEAKEFYEFALDIFNRVCKLLKINKEEIKS
jgi:HEPN domain-containing protein